MSMSVSRWINTVCVLCRWRWYASALYFWLGSHSSLHLTTTALTVGWRCHPPVTVTDRNTLSHHRLRLVPFWV